MIIFDNRRIESIKSKDKLYRVKVGHCLYLEVPPTGNKRWRVRCSFRGLDTFRSLGIFPEVGIEEALARKDVIHSLIRNDITHCKLW